MINPLNYLNNLISHDVDFFTGVPDSLLKAFCACVDKECDEKKHLIAANEGGAIGLAIGNYLGSGKVPMVYLQNSGLGNIINPVLSLASREVYGIPMLIMIGWRGEPKIKDEPQHVHQGRVMLDMLEAMDIPNVILSTDEGEAIQQTNDALELAKALLSPVFLVVRKNTFEAFSYDREASDLSLSREEAIIGASTKLIQDSSVVCTTGMPSRELFEFRSSNNQGHFRDFLSVGGMGHASQIALGLCLKQKDRKVYCFDGDGAALMHLGSLAIIGQSSAQNLIHLIFNNGVHDSVGGQPTVGFGVSFCDIATGCGYASAKTITSMDELGKALDFANNNAGPHLLDIHVRPGNREDIGRPTTTPSENKIAFMGNMSI